MTRKTFLFFFTLSLLFPSFQAVSLQTEISLSLTGGENNSPHVTQKTKEAVLYNFSEALLNAVENCTPYQEDFSRFNPSLQSIGGLFGTKFQINIDIKGYENDTCVFSVINSMGALGKAIYTCAIDKKQQKEIVSAMKDKSKELITETFTVVRQIEEEDGSVQKSEQTTTMTDTKFNIVYAKTTGSACKMKNMEPTPEDKEAFKADFNKLPDDFLSALPICSAQKAKRNILFFSQTAEIKGMTENKCEIVFDKFTLLLPPETAKTIKSWEDIDKFSKDKTFSKFNYKSNYSYDGLMSLIGGCDKNPKCASSSGVATSTFGNVKTKTGMLSPTCSEQECSFKFLNTVSFDNEETNYSIICQIPKTEISKLATEYAPLIEKYGEKSGTNENGGMWFRSAESNEETKEADKKIMLYIQRARMCRYENKPAL